MQYAFPVKCLQADNGTEFVHNATASFLADNGILVCLSCPYTSAQNGKAELSLRTAINNIVCTLFLHSSMSSAYSARALTTATYLLNRRPCSAIRNEIPFSRL